MHDFVEILYAYALWDLWLKPRTTGGRGDLKWKCSANQR